MHQRYINQSIDQIFYSANISGVARLSGPRARSIFKYNIVEAIPYHQQAVGHTGVYGGGGQVEKVCFETSSEGGNWRGWKDR